MTRHDAIDNMGQGKKVTHQDFADNEYLEFKDNRIQTEDGYDYEDQFFNLERLADGWEIYNEE